MIENLLIRWAGSAVLKSCAKGQLTPCRDATLRAHFKRATQNITLFSTRKDTHYFIVRIQNTLRCAALRIATQRCIVGTRAVQERRCSSWRRMAPRGAALSTIPIQI